MADRKKNLLPAKIGNINNNQIQSNPKYISKYIWGPPLTY